MRLSVNPEDPDYKPDVMARSKIRFNGYEVDRVLVADEDRGYIVQAMADENGQVIWRYGEPASVKRYGSVEIVVEEPQKALFYDGGPIDANESVIIHRRSESLWVGEWPPQPMRSV